MPSLPLPWCNSELLPCVLSETFLRPRCAVWLLFLSHFMPLMTAQCSNVSRSLCKASCPSIAPCRLVLSTDVVMVCLTAASGSLIETLNRSGPGTEPRYGPIPYNPRNSTHHPLHCVPAHLPAGQPAPWTREDAAAAAAPSQCWCPQWKGAVPTLEIL